MNMKKTILSLITALLLVIPAAAGAKQRTPLDDRRTLFVPFGQKTLVFEAPTDMCFLDSTAGSQAKLLKFLREEEARKHKRQLMAVFADCMQIAGFTGSMPRDAGMIFWMNPAVGETTALPTGDYLDMRESGLIPHVEETLKEFSEKKVDVKPRRAGNLVSVAYDADVKFDFETLESVGIDAATVIRGIPVDFTIRHAEKTAPKRDALYAQMEKLVAQQIALNE